MREQLGVSVREMRQYAKKGRVAKESGDAKEKGVKGSLIESSLAES